MSASNDLGDAIGLALDKYPVADVLSVITGAFVGLTVELVRVNCGNEIDKPITVNGGAQRDITIHPPKTAKAQEAPC